MDCIFKLILICTFFFTTLPLSAEAEVRYFDSPNDIAQFILEKSRAKDFKAILDTSALSGTLEERLPFIEYGKFVSLILLANDCDLIEKTRFSSELAKPSDVEKMFKSLGCTIKDSTVESYVQSVLHHSINNVHQFYTSLHKISELNISEQTKLTNIQSDLSSDLYSGQYMFTYRNSNYSYFTISSLVIKHPQKGFTFFFI